MKSPGKTSLDDLAGLKGMGSPSLLASRTDPPEPCELFVDDKVETEKSVKVSLTNCFSPEEQFKRRLAKTLRSETLL